MDTYNLHSMRFWCAAIFAAVMVYLAGLHAYWAMGGKWGTLATVPTVGEQRTFNPGPAATWVVAFLLVVAAVIVCGQAGVFAAGSWSPLFQVGAWCLCGVFLLRAIGNFKTVGLFKSVRGTPFAYWDTRLYSPLCVFLAVLAGVVAWGRD